MQVFVLVPIVWFVLTLTDESMNFVIYNDIYFKKLIVSTSQLDEDYTCYSEYYEKAKK